MPDKQVIPVATSLLLRVPSMVLEEQCEASADVVGEELAWQIQEYIRRERLGYYPALGLFMDYGGIESCLLEAVRNIAWLAKELVQDEVYRLLGQVFNYVEIESMCSTAFTLPRIHPTQTNAGILLASHYTPDTVRLTLVLGVTSEQAGSEGVESYVRRMLWRWLKDNFPSMEVTCSTVLDQSYNEKHLPDRKNAKNAG